MDKDKCDHNCDSSEEETAGNWKHAKRTRVEKAHQSAASMKRPAISSPFPSTSGRAVPGSSRTQRPSSQPGKSPKNPWSNYLKDSTSRTKGRPTGSLRPCDKRSQTENWMKAHMPLTEIRQPLENPTNRRPHTTTPAPSPSASYSDIRARHTNIYIEKLIAARSRGHYKHLSNIDLMQCKKLDKILDNDLWTEWAWMLLRDNEARRRARTGSPVAGSSSTRAEIGAPTQPAWSDRPSTSRLPNCPPSVCPKQSQPSSSTSLPVAPERSLRISDTPLTTDQVELLVQCDDPLAADAVNVSAADPRDTSDGPDDSACRVSFAEDSPVTRASKEFIDGGFITHLVGSLNRIVPEPDSHSLEPPIVPSISTPNDVILNVAMDETPDSVDAHDVAHNISTDSLQPGEDALCEENADEQEQVQIQPSASQESLTNAPAELDISATKENVNDGLNKAILSLLECPVCMEVMAPPLAQCRRGHLLCQGCRKLITSCPTCRSRFTASRNLAMEKVAEKLLYPCRHTGCTAVLPFKQRGQHEASCGQRAYLCSMPRCKERTHLQYDQLLQHHQTNHADILLWGNVTNFEIDIVNESMQDDWLVRAHNELFHIHFCVDTDNWGINSSVTYIGPKKNAQNFIYKMSVEDNSQYNRKFSYQRATHSDMENREMNYSRRDAFFIPLDGALFLARKKKSDRNKFSNFLCVTLNIKCKNRGEANKGEVDEDVANGNVE